MKIIKTSLITLVASFISLAVILSAVHAKDLAGPSKERNSANVVRSAPGNEVVAKALGDLHSHVDKQTLKVMTSTVSDQPILATHRDIKTLVSKEDRTLSDLATEWLLMFRLARAYVYAK